ncbi:hypothetical protein A3D84_05395 [Candidatus Woesebacteria bacterium RIFCSPHIGHO2_02_FULL_42_20]|uniref:Galactosyldiacylglycerol synthase n=1 Tax=Candidatus Woesebacteria bacterium RIFCSPHIGHO2_12_FULL_41_24 TaxID=1802510 RepID=A0A1F8AR55_9BACT|nr:MAG: hypothetical protein A2W15_04615 [Candidatus Woesebacteria bacterium RBG_16_41_13]OGM34624.1 MAG: hypothetical protein A3D84_05395 [Candidatus Woesebacteria bacterium RIFCSPHIGHO2_02_FULL_42_20]OGM53778.1 MAG: hypothetical protein A3E44_05160 [Candidatus Woesebacteria bacterium RIFCSPHIGHO2_12_FULL_41_24]OGM66311.1 MAG: hypothetical protein A2969_01815 [Candidatus Woesebacteria bacterium RIFCSPLOWO2_01_FULL_42_67]
MELKKILILMAKTGGGHNAVAEAVKEVFDKSYKGRVEAQVVDGLRTFAPFPISHLDSTYPWQIKLDGGLTYGAAWRLLNHKGIAKGFMRSWQPVVESAAKKIVNQKVDAIVITHPVFVHPCVWAIKKFKKKTKFIVIVPDLKVTHALYGNPDIDLMLVPSHECFDQAIRHGVSSQKIKLVGLPLRMSFRKKYPAKKDLRKNLGFDPNKSLVLLMGGGEGLGSFKKTAVYLNKLKDIQTIAFVGKNDNLKNSLLNENLGPDFHVQGFTDEIAMFMKAADIVVTKAGPTTICEALVCGLPIIINGFIPNQESKNAKYVEEIGSGKIVEDPEKITRTVKRWLKDKSLLTKMAKNALDSSDPKSALKAAKEIYNFLATK